MGSFWLSDNSVREKVQIELRIIVRNVAQGYTPSKNQPEFQFLLVPSKTNEWEETYKLYYILSTSKTSPVEYIA